MIARFAVLLFTGGCLWGAVELLASAYVAWQVEQWGRVVGQARREVIEDMERWA